MPSPHSITTHAHMALIPLHSSRSHSLLSLRRLPPPEYLAAHIPVAVSHGRHDSLSGPLQSRYPSCEGGAQRYLCQLRHGSSFKGH